MFQCDKQTLLNWFAAKGYRGNLTEMTNAYFASLDGGGGVGKSSTDAVLKRLHKLGFQNKGGLHDCLNEFFKQKTGISDRVQAQAKFFSNPANDFS